MNIVEEYLKSIKKKAIPSNAHFKSWIQNKYGRSMDRPLYAAKGLGGGQTYKTLWEVIVVNKDIPVYFYNENVKAIHELEKRGHISIESWIKLSSIVGAEQ